LVDSNALAVAQFLKATSGRAQAASFKRREDLFVLPPPSALYQALEEQLGVALFRSAVVRTRTLTRCQRPTT